MGKGLSQEGNTGSAQLHQQALPGLSWPQTGQELTTWPENVICLRPCRWVWHRIWEYVCGSIGIGSLCLPPGPLPYNTFILLFFGGEILLSMWPIGPWAGCWALCSWSGGPNAVWLMVGQSWSGSWPQQAWNGAGHNISSQLSWALSGWSAEPAGTWEHRWATQRWTTSSLPTGSVGGTSGLLEAPEDST